MKDEILIQQALAVLQHSKSIHRQGVLIFGGSFNPPTLGHLDLIRLLLGDPSLQDQSICLLPNYQSPLKSLQSYASPADRLAMLELMLDTHFHGAGQSRITIERLEIDQLQPSRMILTLAALILRHQGQQSYTLVCGRDLLSSFKQWYRWTSFKGICRLRFYPRQGLPGLHEADWACLDELVAAGIDLTLVCNQDSEFNDLEAFRQQSPHRLTQIKPSTPGCRLVQQ